MQNDYVELEAFRNEMASQINFEKKTLERFEKIEETLTKQQKQINQLRGMVFKRK